MLIRNIWGIGRNYLAHIAELGNDRPEEPIVFLKAGSSATVNSNELVLPWWAEDVHHEVELALKFGSHLQIIEAAVALDLTERTAQTAAKNKGLPWTKAKSFHNACAISAMFPIPRNPWHQHYHLKLWVNEELRQDASTELMIFPVPTLIEYTCQHFPVCPGDFLLTGTPAGVGPLRDGDRVKAQIVDHITHTWTVRKEAPPAT